MSTNPNETDDSNMDASTAGGTGGTGGTEGTGPPHGDQYGDFTRAADVLLKEMERFRAESADRERRERHLAQAAEVAAAASAEHNKKAQQAAREADDLASIAQTSRKDVLDVRADIQAQIDKLEDVKGPQAALAIINKHAQTMVAQNAILQGLVTQASQNKVAQVVTDGKTQNVILDNTRGKHQVKMPQMKMSYCTAQEFFRFERQVRTCARVSKWTEQEEIDNVFGNLLGPASDNVKSMSIKRTEYANMSMFYKQLRLKFVDSAYQARAREQYSVAVQTSKESLRNFHIRLYSLWFDALAQEEEPWCFDDKIQCPTGHNREQPGSKSKSLISAFLNGLRDPDVKDKIRELKDEGGFDTYEDILQKAVLRESHVQLRRKDRLITQNRDKLQEMYMDRRFEQRIPQHSQQQPQYQRDMGVGFVTRRSQAKKKGPNSRKGRSQSQGRRTYAMVATSGRGQEMQKVEVPPGYALTPVGQTFAVTNPTMVKPMGNKYCKIHKTNSHDTSQCRAKNSQGKKNVHWAPNSGKSRDKSQDKCHVCQKSGHWARECPEKRRGNLNLVGNQEYENWSNSKGN